ncbi:MAG: cell division protein FtsQ/DivIB [Pseudoramibacter sp.]
MKDKRNKGRKARPPKKHKRKILVHRVILFVLVIVLICVGGYYLLCAANSPYLKIKKVEVAGSTATDTHLLDDITGPLIGQNMLTVDVNSLSNQVKKSLHTRQVSVFRRWPDTLIIKAGNTEMIGAVITGGTVLYVDGNGSVIDRANYLSNVNLPIISGIPDVQRLKEHRALSSSSQEKLDDALAILSALKAKGFIGKISEIHWTKYNTYRIITKNNSVFEVTGIDNFKKNKSYIETFLRENRSNVEVDLQIDHHAFMKNRT